MNRAARSLFLGLSLSLAAFAAPAPDLKQPDKKGPSLDQIKKAIDDLGSKRFAVRDKAKKLLNEVGAEAEPLLEEAAKSSDPEIAGSAKAVLEKFQWGLYPDTPKAIRDLIEQFRAGDASQRQNAIMFLLKKNPIPFATLRKLYGKEENIDARDQMFSVLREQLRESIPNLLGGGDFSSAEDLFELTLIGSPSFSGHDYATFMYLRGKLDSTIARFEKKRLQKGEKGEHAAEMLVHLYRIKGDWAAARKAAEDAKQDDLVERVLWQSADWKALARFSRKPDVENRAGLIAAYERLAGNSKEFDEQIEQIKKSAEDSMGESIEFRFDTEALLLNGRANDAIKILADRKRELARTFDLLCAQMKHKEAFALVDEARRRDTNPRERNEIEVRRAKMLYMLGERDSALQLFQKVADEIKGTEDSLLANSLVKTVARLGLRDLAAENAAKATATLMKSGQRNDFSKLFEPIFGDDHELALAWWRLFRKELPDEDPIAAMKRVRDIFAGKLDRKKLDEWIAKMEKEPTAKLELDRRGLPTRQGNTHYWALVAIASAYRAIGDQTKTEEYLKKAAERSPSADRWIAYGDFLMGKKKYKEAAASFARAAKAARHPKNVDVEFDDDVVILSESKGPALATYLQGRATTLGGDEKEGKRLIELAHWLPLGNEQTRAHLVEALNKRDLPELARKEADMLLKTGWYSHYSYGNIMSFLARQAVKEKDYAKASDYYEKCIVGCLRTGARFIEPTAYLLVPESVRVYRARSLISHGKIEAGLKEAMANLEVMPGNIDLAIKLVPELDKHDKKKEAEAIYVTVRDVWEKLSKDYPNSAFALNSTAWLMANCRRDLDTALKHADKAVELEPKSAGYIDTLAEVRFRKGDRDGALSLMKKCVELDAKNPYFKKQLARFKVQPFSSPTPDEGEDEEN